MTRPLLVLVLVLATFPATSRELPASPSPPSTDGRLAVFVSDLHMGVGRDPDDSKQWHATEDFRWHREFSDFLHAMNERGDGRVDLVLVGDILELWQTLPGEPSCEYNDDRGCTECEAVARTRRVVEQHQEVFEALKRFVSPNNRNFVTFVPGNHDVALAFPGVRKEVLGAIAANPPDRVRVATEGYWRSADGTVIAEHGQQVGKDPNRFIGWPLQPFASGEGAKHLHQSWGENFVQQMFNTYELDYPIIDNLSSESLGARYAAKHLGWKATTLEVGKFVRFLLFQQTWRQAAQGLGTRDGRPQWMVDDIAFKNSGECWTFLAGSLDPDDPLRDTLLKDEELRGQSCELDVDEIATACDRRWALFHAMPAADIKLCPHDSKLGSVLERGKQVVDSRARATAYQARLDELREAMPNDRPTRTFTTYVYGHTHQEHLACTPYPNRDTWRPVVINDGAWQRTASEAEFCRLLLGRDPKQALADLRPEDLPGCYPFVLRERGELKLRFWEQASPQAKGEVVEACQSRRTIPPECKALAVADACPAWPK